MSSPSKPAVLPVIYNVTWAELEAAKSQYRFVLNYSNKNKNVVSVIDEVMDARKKGKPHCLQLDKVSQLVLCLKNKKNGD